MKKFVFLLLLCFGLSMGANAQNAEVVTKADKSAYEFASALKDALNGTCSQDVFEQKCTEIGFRIGFTYSLMSTDEQRLYLNVLPACLQSYCEQFEVDPAIGDIIIKALIEEIKTDGQPAPQTESIAAMADRYAKEMARMMGDSMNGVDNEEEAERLGVQLGIDLVKIGGDNVKLFQNIFYESLRTYLLQIDGIDTDICSLVIELLKAEYDAIFEQFYN